MYNVEHVMNNGSESSLKIVKITFLLILAIASLNLLTNNNILFDATSTPNNMNINMTTRNKVLSSIDELIEKIEKPSQRILLNYMKDYYYYDDDATVDLMMVTDADEERRRCKRYGYKYDGRQTRRRIFFGGLIADDSWDTIAVHAAEAYGLYHTVAFIESQATLSSDNSQSRKLRFPQGSLNNRVLRRIFGPTTKVSVDVYVDRPDDRPENNRTFWIYVEDLQRELILERWKQNGMTEEDIGIVGDVDEMFSRDFLLAAQTCDVPEFRPGQDCLIPKLVSKTLIFDMTPECIPIYKHYWFHPDMIIGECIDKVGNSSIHKPGKRDYNGLGRRVQGYGETYKDYSKMPNTTMFPLWKPVDFRSTEGGFFVKKAQKFTGYHLHNFFATIRDIRVKYKTYGHEVEEAGHIPLGALQEDIHFAINCVLERPDTSYFRDRIIGGFEAIDGPTPILYQKLPEYREARHNEIKDMILEDEALFGQYIYLPPLSSSSSSGDG